MPINHKKLGLKAGLEIHQQLNTNKLFCNCPFLLRSDAPQFTVERILNPVVGETGVVDTAAAFEKLKDKKFTYQVFDTNCLVELDEEPPHDINKDSLRIALQISLLFNCKIFPVSQIMRKTVIDGSNTSGFQRTVLVAHDGYVETSEGKVRIETIALEEDSARPTTGNDDEPGTKNWKLDRLGVPLVEITTAPDLKSPEQIKEAALKIGEILRACDVKRGIGTIRQDVNISISDGRRVEIKGFQDPRIMLSTVDNEMIRQKKLSEIKDNFKKVKISKMVDLSKTFKDTKCKFIEKALKQKEGVFGFSLSSLSGILGVELQPNKRIGTDFSDYAKPLSKIGGIIHSDEDLSKYDFSEVEINETKRFLDIKSKDAYILIVGTKEQAEKARSAIETRLKQLSSGAPKEVRRSNPDSTTTFLRPMPGAARMYPETDCQLLRVKKQQVDELKSNLPKLASENKRYLQEFGLNEELVKLLLKQNKIEDFKELTNTTDHYQTLAKAITIFSTEIARKENFSKEEIQEKLNLEILASIFEKVGNEIATIEVKPIMHKIAQGQSLKEALEKADIHLSEEIKKLIKEKPGLSQGAYMGLIMGKFKGKVTGSEVSQELQKVMK
jgi:glutamyl-tRNA(Gln) amidotransferase subunit E